MTPLQQTALDFCQEEWERYARDALQDDGAEIVEYSFVSMNTSFATGFQAGREYEAAELAALKHDLERAQDASSGALADMSELIRVALTNPTDLRGFIQANYPKDYAEFAVDAQDMPVHHEIITLNDRQFRHVGGGVYRPAGVEEE